jgi:hypothetical protein
MPSDLLVDLVIALEELGFMSSPQPDGTTLLWYEDHIIHVLRTKAIDEEGDPLTYERAERTIDQAIERGRRSSVQRHY